MRTAICTARTAVRRAKGIKTNQHPVLRPQIKRMPV
jgi:hypothetical protein